MANWSQPDAFIWILKFLRANHRDEEIDEEQQRDDADDDGFHVCLKFVAEAHVKSADDEKQNYSAAKNDVVHKIVRLAQLRDGQPFLALDRAKIGAELRRTGSKASSRLRER